MSYQPPSFNTEQQKQLHNISSFVAARGGSVYNCDSASNFFLGKQQNYNTEQQLLQSPPLLPTPSTFFGAVEGGGSFLTNNPKGFPFHQENVGCSGGIAVNHNQGVGQQPSPNPLVYFTGQPTATDFSTYYYQQQQQLQLQMHHLFRQWQLLQQQKQQQGVGFFPSPQNVHQLPLQTYQQQQQMTQTQTNNAQNAFFNTYGYPTISNSDASSSSLPSTFSKPQFYSIFSSTNVGHQNQIIKSEMCEPPQAPASIPIMTPDNNEDSDIICEDLSDTETVALQSAGVCDNNGMMTQTYESVGLKVFGANQEVTNANATKIGMNEQNVSMKKIGVKGQPQWMLRFNGDYVKNLLILIREIAQSPFIDLICEMLADSDTYGAICRWVRDAKGRQKRLASTREWRICNSKAFTALVSERFPLQPRKSFMQLNRALKVYEMNKDIGGRSWGRLLLKMPDRRNHFRFFPDSE